MTVDDETQTPAGRYLKQRMDALGFKTKADLADTAEVSRSTITRLFKRADYRPDVDVMRRLARTLQVDHDTLVAAIYGEDAAPPDAAPMHPLANELDRMVGRSSPLAAQSRQMLIQLVDRVMDGARREMRGGKTAPATQVVLIESQADHDRIARIFKDEAGRISFTGESALESLHRLLGPDTPLNAVERRHLATMLDSLVELTLSVARTSVAAAVGVPLDDEGNEIRPGVPQPGSRLGPDLERLDGGARVRGR